MFIDEGYKKNGIAISIPAFESVFVDGLVCFASSSFVSPIQLADFAAYCLNRTQLILGKNELSFFDKRLLEILTPITWNYQNIDKQIIDPDQWKDRFGSDNQDLCGTSSSKSLCYQIGIRIWNTINKVWRKH